MPSLRHLRLSPVPHPVRALGGLRGLALAPLVALVAACSDVSPTSPAAPAARPSFATGSGGSGSTALATVPRTETFVYRGRALTQSFGGGHSVRFDANAVCDPATSGYGPGTWDQPCAPATQSITFTVTSWRDANGRVQVSFSPDVRFVPGTTEVLYLNENPGSGRKATVQWCSPLVNGCVDESLTDPTLATWISGGQVARRIKHFSGYNVLFGFADESF